jgi:hypothetical protein
VEDVLVDLVVAGGDLAELVASRHLRQVCSPTVGAHLTNASPLPPLAMVGMIVTAIGPHAPLSPTPGGLA